jgi:tRNA(fMet)-specific endonuclease VapC
MVNYLLDTHHAAALWRRQSGLVARINAVGDAAIHMCNPAIGDLWYRIYNGPNPSENERSLHEFLARFQVLDYDSAAAVEFGLIKFALWRIRRPISDVDVQIAAIGRTRGMTVLTAEQHFQTVPKLRVENWLV